VCIAVANGKKHDFQLFKDSKIKFKIETLLITDTGYQGVKKLHSNSQHPKKKSKKKPLTLEDKIQNKAISRDRVLNENVIGLVKRFKIISDRYRNRRKRFGLRFNLIAGIHNYEL
jgi:hypothetical protein